MSPPLYGIDPSERTLRDGRRVRLAPIRGTDAERYREHMVSIAGESSFGGMLPGEVPDAEALRDRLGKTDRHWRLGVFCDESGAMVGDCTWAPAERAKFEHVARLGIGVRAGWRGFGLGRLMMVEAVEAARRDPAVLRLELLVYAKNKTARALYRSVGFVEEGRNDRSVRQPDGSFDDDVHMAMWLAD